MSSHEVQILSTTVAVPFARAYDFAHRPENFPKWAAGLSKTLHKTEHGWVADTPEGEAIVSFSPPNPYGVLDHRVQLAGKPEVYIPLRLVENGDGTEVELMLLRQPHMSDADFANDANAIRTDLASLKALLEKENGAAGED